jgi:hypothetical protein
MPASLQGQTPSLQNQHRRGLCRDGMLVSFRTAAMRRTRSLRNHRYPLHGLVAPEVRHRSLRATRGVSRPESQAREANGPRQSRQQGDSSLPSECGQLAVGLSRLPIVTTATMSSNSGSERGGKISCRSLCSRGISLASVHLCVLRGGQLWRNKDGLRYSKMVYGIPR